MNDAIPERGEAQTAQTSVSRTETTNGANPFTLSHTGLIAGFRRARSWRVPPNWSPIDWYEELRALTAFAAWQAEQDYDSSRGVPVSSFVYCRVMAQALARYRQEWRFALRSAASNFEIVATIAVAESSDATSEVLEEAMDLLPEPERWLLLQLFWQHRTEAGIADQLHISQPAVSKRKRAALLHLRDLL